MSESKREKEARAGSDGAAVRAGQLWFIGWLFTIGFAELSFWKAVVAVIAWPYFLGAALR